jgi:spore germination cell wall hydrolase CwlJ-like protein
MGETNAKPLPRERPIPAMPLSRPALEVAAGPQALLPRRKPLPDSTEADIATGSLGAGSAAARHEREALCLAKAIYFEARGKPLAGQFAVARVVLNRAADRRFPDTICEVVYQDSELKHRCQFSFACDGMPDEPEDETAWALARGMAEAMLRSERPQISTRVLRATHYHADYVAPWWAPKLRHAGQVGRHIFYVRPRKTEARHASAAEPPGD